MGDARTGKRFPVELPIRIHVRDSEDEQAGTTANVSAAGVYIRAASPGRKRTQDGDRDGQPWRPGATVEFDMTLPAAVIGARDDVRIRCQGRIVRIDRIAGEHNGVACVIDKYEFVRKH